MSEQPDNAKWQDVISSVLSFYSSQLTSHAGLVVGFLLAFFTLVQVHESIGDLVFQFAAVSVVSMAVYSLLRIGLYGSLSGILLRGSVGDFRKYVDKHPELLDHARVNGYAAYWLEYSTTVRGWLYGYKTSHSERADRDAAWWIQLPMIASFAAGLIVVYSMFGSLNILWVLFVGAVLILIVYELGLRTAKPLPKSPAPSLSSEGPRNGQD